MALASAILAQNTYTMDNALFEEWENSESTQEDSPSSTQRNEESPFLVLRIDCNSQKPKIIQSPDEEYVGVYDNKELHLVARGIYYEAPLKQGKKVRKNRGRCTSTKQIPKQKYRDIRFCKNSSYVIGRPHQSETEGKLIWEFDYFGVSTFNPLKEKPRKLIPANQEEAKHQKSGLLRENIEYSDAIPEGENVLVYYRDLCVSVVPSSKSTSRYTLRFFDFFDYLKEKAKEKEKIEETTD